MSGFAGIIHLDGKAVEPALLQRMTGAAQRHGGAECSIHLGGNFGFGYSLLTTTAESELEQQPQSFDGSLWIIGDARIDERELLVSRLKAQGRQASLTRPDIELILHSYYCWGEACVEHFHGDFAFLVWHQSKRKLFCARDSFGVKPFYYVHQASTFIFSNDLGALQLFPGVSTELNEAAIGDFLAFGYNLDEQATCFRDIARLRPAGKLELGGDNSLALSEFCVINYSGQVRYKSPHDYHERFLELFNRSVTDRLRTNRVAFELSGGLDSTSVVSMAATINRDNPKFSGKAITTYFGEQPLLDEEVLCAEMVADKHHIAHETIRTGTESDFYTYTGTSQPYAWPFANTSVRYADAARQHARVLLSGQGSDAVLLGSGYQLVDDYRESTLPEFAVKLVKSAVRKRSLRGLGLRGFAAKDHPRVEMPKIPGWIRSEFIFKAGSVERWKELFYRENRYPEGCQAEFTFDVLRMPAWTNIFENYYHDLLCGIDCRHPFFDIRLVNFLLAIPPSLKKDKYLLRVALKDILPDQVRTRSKSVVVGDIVQNRLADKTSLDSLDLSFERYKQWIDEEQYVQALKRYAHGENFDRFSIVCPLSLAQWTGNGKML